MAMAKLSVHAPCNQLFFSRRAGSKPTLLRHIIPILSTSRREQQKQARLSHCSEWQWLAGCAAPAVLLSTMKQRAARPTD
eukprot:7417884-Alexandrium_andersonii.AAC.1